MIEGIVAIVGRPNVGKSTIFNRMIGERLSIVEDTPGVTRDRIYGKCTWLTKEFRCIDTGGIQMENQPFQNEIQMQVEIALEEADSIVFVTSAKEGVTSDDEYIARMLRKSKKPVVLAVNKVDDTHMIDSIYEFYQLGLGDPIAVSGSHGIGMGDLLDTVVSTFKKPVKDEYDGRIRFAVIGRPNVGKSSLVNALLNQERVIVSDVEGTTRDAIDTPFTRDGKEYVVIDTAGIRKKGKIYENIEKYSILRAMSAIERSDVILFVLDGESGIREQDKHVAGYAHEAGKAIIIVYNKWDTVEKDDKTMSRIEREIREQFLYLSYAPIVFVSAKTKQKVQNLFPVIENVYHYSQLRIATNVLNEVLEDAQITTPPPTHNGKRLRINYASQVATAPPTIVLFVNDVDLLHFSYQRYLENKLREAFGFDGNPIRILARLKKQ
ncbi:MAG: ribosome biogenesis GTPase Der [Erysipelotrichaceae bacterium]|nr:ribosome biogenesis GTPase Der [Erysipelotrichaceae bacterium]